MCWLLPEPGELDIQIGFYGFKPFFSRAGRAVGIWAPYGQYVQNRIVQINVIVPAVCLDRSCHNCKCANVSQRSCITLAAAMFVIRLQVEVGIVNPGYHSS